MNGYRSLLPCQTLICSGLMKQNTIQQSNVYISIIRSLINTYRCSFNVPFIRQSYKTLLFHLNSQTLVLELVMSRYWDGSCSLENMWMNTILFVRSRMKKYKMISFVSMFIGNCGYLQSIRWNDLKALFQSRRPGECRRSLARYWRIWNLLLIISIGPWRGR